jgi:ribonucleoside-triphosphate reductase (thioredoxin)
MDDYQRYIYTSRYARFDWSKGRRETWDETVDRYCTYMNMPQDVADGIRNMEVMPSMRALWAAGPALDRCNVGSYNCSYLPLDSTASFAELMYVLMSGCGVGFSVERQNICKLPEVKAFCTRKGPVIVVTDSRDGWSRSFELLLEGLFRGEERPWDLSHVRPEGAILKTFGGRSSGPAPLDRLFKFATAMFKAAAGRKLTSIECHDLACMTGEIVVAGGVRRSALISLSNLSDDRMRHAKSGAWYETHPHRAMANNSAVYVDKPDAGAFLREWHALYESKSGERGIFNRTAAQDKAREIGRNADYEFGTNPCSEICLRPYQFCNLTEVVMRKGDTREELMRKVRLATIIGTYQSMLTNFKFIRPEWIHNCEEERLLGVSLTGIKDFGDEDFYDELREIAVNTNIKWSAKLGIPRSAAITCVKPSGTVSQLVDSSSGIHRRFSKYYIRRVIGDKNDPLTKMLVDQNAPHKVQSNGNVLFEFPREAPGDVKPETALEQLAKWRQLSDKWAEHSVSCTIYYRDDEFIGLGAAVYAAFDSITGISFLPESDHVYVDPPYEAIDEQTFRLLDDAFPAIEWSKLSDYETTDETQGAKTAACVGGACEI